MENGMQMTLPGFEQMISQRPRFTVSDFRAKVSALLESEAVSQIREALYSLKSCDWLKFDSLNIYSLRTSEDSSTMTVGLHSRPSSEAWSSLGMAWNGRCVTANISEFHKIGRECSLSDILEESVDPKYFLSEHTVNRLLNYTDNQLQTV